MPVKFRKASIREGKLVGDFDFIIYSDRKIAEGRMSARGEIISLVLNDTLVSQDSTSILVMRELLKLMFETQGQSSENVLGVTTDGTGVTVGAGQTSVGTVSSTVIARRF